MAERKTRITFHSILFERPEDRTGDDATEAPDFFTDLNCHLIVDDIASGKDKEEYALKPLFYTHLHRVDAIKYRHEVMQDLENAAVFERVLSFTQKMRDMRRHLDLFRTLHYKQHKQAWFLDGVEIYCNAVNTFVADLSRSHPKSRGLNAWCKYLQRYAESPPFTALVSETKERKADLEAVRYAILLQRGGRFTVRNYASEPDYSIEVVATFAKFKQGAVEGYQVKTEKDDGGEMNHIEAKILEFVARLHPDVFMSLDDYCSRHADFIDKTIATFDREVQFYISYLQYIADLKKAGLHFCYPLVSDKNKAEFVHDGFDLALAHNLVRYRKPVVCNSFYLEGQERILVVTGPNQGGKTTFARMFGQVHYLASLGLPVPGTRAQLFLFDNLFTHFEREEKVENLRGKLEDDLVRIHSILQRATSHSVIVLNEIFTSTTLHDEIYLSTKLMQHIAKMDLLCVWVTFVDELSSFGPQTVSMVSTVNPENPAIRTFTFVRRLADGLAYAMAIARKYNLTYDSIKKRITP